MARALGIDLGSKRIGVASSDTTRTLASPVAVVQRRGSRSADHKAISEIISEYEPDVIVVGLPLSLNGSESHAAALVRAEITEMEKVFTVPIVAHDERFSTATAHASMMERKMNAQARRKVVDKVAAAVMLQSWLDSEAHRRNHLSDRVHKPDQTRSTSQSTDQFNDLHAELAANPKAVLP